VDNTLKLKPVSDTDISLRVSQECMYAYLDSEGKVLFYSGTVEMIWRENPLHVLKDWSHHMVVHFENLGSLACSAMVKFKWTLIRSELILFLNMKNASLSHN
jgi:hypothetical protein